MRWTLEQLFSDTVHFTIGQAAMSTGDHLYFSPVVYSNFSESPFKLKERNYPVTSFPYEGTP